MHKEWGRIEEALEDFVEKKKVRNSKNNDFSYESLQLLYEAKSQEIDPSIDSLKEYSQTSIELFVAKMERTGFLDLKGDFTSFYEMEVDIRSYTLRELQEAEEIISEIS